MTSDSLASRVEKAFTDLRVKFETKRMMGGICFMVSGKMCVGTAQSLLMVRFDPERHDEVLARPGARLMDFTGRPMRGYVFVDPSVLRGAVLKSWLELALAYNPQAKRSKKKNSAGKPRASGT